MTVGTFGPMEWGAVVGLIAHWGVNTVQRYLWLYERGTVPGSRQQWRTVCDQVHGNVKKQTKANNSAIRAQRCTKHTPTRSVIHYEHVDTRITRGWWKYSTKIQQKPQSDGNHDLPGVWSQLIIQPTIRSNNTQTQIRPPPWCRPTAHPRAHCRMLRLSRDKLCPHELVLCEFHTFSGDRFSLTVIIE